MYSEEIVEEAAEYIKEISTSKSFPFSDGRLSSKAIGHGFDFSFNEKGDEPQAIIYGELEDDTMKIRYGFEDQYNEALVQDKNSAIPVINLAMDHILAEMEYSGKEQYLKSKSLPTTVE